MEQLRTMTQRRFLARHTSLITSHGSVDEVAKWAEAFKENSKK